ncbi:MAG: nucleotide exchange factor GrpE [Armatimonadetes bacterium]|nr:nucleotide exchange factor GrpE [Armatimonadota bacterium]
MIEPEEPSDVKEIEGPLDATDDGRIADLEAQVADLERQLAETRDGMLRAIADLQNYRRRSVQDMQHAKEAVAAGLAGKLLPVLDNFERTLEAAEAGTNIESLIEGVRLVDKQLRAALEEYNVRPILAVGLPFDPHIHEAVATEDSEHDEGTVIGEIERGYAIGKKVLRPTKARVSKGKKS